MMEGKKEMIRELSFAAWSIVDKAAKQEQSGTVSRQDAQKQALLYIQSLRYGSEIKDYFWVMDLKPRMLMHPYRSDLIGINLYEYNDNDGPNVFSEFVSVATENGDGYVKYMWEDKVDPNRKVPKLSYVKLFEPWGWIIGTGIYLEDVRRDISSLTNRLLTISLLITAIISILLFFITRESLKIETQRQQNEKQLLEAGQKYKSLVDASTEGVMMLVDNTIVYSNRILEEMSGYSEREINNKRLNELIILAPSAFTEIKSLEECNNLDRSIHVEAMFQHKKGTSFDTLLSISPIEINNQAGVIFIVKDISTQKEIAGELGATREKFEHLTDNISIGVFRTTFNNEVVFVEANPAAATIFGVSSVEQLYGQPIRDYFNDTTQYQRFIRILGKESTVSNMILTSIQEGLEVILSITAVLVFNARGERSYCDGFVEDITKRYKREQEREGLLSELQAGLLFQNEPINRAYSVAVPGCNMKTTVEIASKFMVHANASAILIRPDNNANPIGIVTDIDIRERVVARGLSTDTPVSEIMSAPLIGISGDALIFEGIVKMLENRVDHLLLKDSQGIYYKVISAKNLLKNQQYVLTKLISDIEQVEVPVQLSVIKNQLPQLMLRMFENTPDARNLTRIVSSVAEAVMRKCVALAINEIGAPPCKFAFIALGSVGREEQTLVTDQDNAIIYEDVDESLSDNVAAYFNKMGEKVCLWLDDAGYVLCKGDIMARNPKWCQPVSVWQKYFSSWITAMEPAGLLDAKIFFDFRWVYGDVKMVRGLYSYLNTITNENPLFFYHLAQNCLYSKPPLNIFKNIVVESSGEHREKFSIKKAMTPLVDYTRIYALRHGISQSNTFARFNQLQVKGHLSEKECRELTLVYKYLMELRFKHQILSLSEGKEPDNYINPKMVTAMEQVQLREALSQVADFQTKMGFDFKQV